MNKLPTPETDDLDRELHNPRVLQDRYSEMMEHAQNMERERDEAREEIEALRHEYHGAKAMAGGFKDKIKSLTEERDEAREVLREIAEASSFDNIGNWARNKARKEIDQYREKSDLPPISWDV